MKLVFFNENTKASIDLVTFHLSILKYKKGKLNEGSI